MSYEEEFGGSSVELPQTNFYVLLSDVTTENVHITNKPELPLYYDNWCNGKRIDIDLPLPLKYEVEDFDEHGGILRNYYEELEVPLMSKRLIQALRDCGIDNLDTYDAAIHFKSSGEVNTDYQAVNIIGLVHAADMEKSKYTTSGLTENEDELSSVWFNELVLDEDKIKDLLFFRMAENMITILIRKSVKEKIEEEFPDLEFMHPQDYSG